MSTFSTPIAAIRSIWGVYLSSLCPSIADADTNLHPGVRLTCQCDQVVLDLDAGTALGLIVTELISNSLENAFPDGTGSISVSLTSGQSGDDATLIVSDNGVGVPENKDGNHPGLSLVKRLMEQVKGLGDDLFGSWHQVGSEVSKTNRSTGWCFHFTSLADTRLGGVHREILPTVSFAYLSAPSGRN